LRTQAKTSITRELFTCRSWPMKSIVMIIGAWLAGALRARVASADEKDSWWSSDGPHKRWAV
jgi:hypothetical protein